YAGSEYARTVLISTDGRYEQPIERIKDSPLRSIEVKLKRVHPFGDFSLFGWHPGWLGTYFFMSLAVSLLLRRALKLS
ncbi:MAG: hypothetical protein ABIH41_03995, partial [Nanoarchaeota archaeon]